MGLNRFVIHTSVHQPVNDKIPGLGLGPSASGSPATRPGRRWPSRGSTYLARSSYMLQQGKFVADVVYFYGEDSNITALFGNKAPDVPAGYNFDYVNADALLHRLSVANGRITTPSGMSYRVLALDPNSRHMSLPVLRKIRDLVNAGAVVAGPKPIDSPSLQRRPGGVPDHRRSVVGLGDGRARLRQGQGLRRPDAGADAGRA